MVSPHDRYRKQIAENWADLCAYEKVAQTVNQRINDLRELIRATANLLPDAERGNELLLLDVFKHPSNITEAVKTVLFIAGARDERLTPTDIKARAEERGFDFSEYTNPLASIHTILRRMKESTPPEVDFSEADGTYLLIAGVGDLSHEFLEKHQKELWIRMANRVADPEKIRQLIMEISPEIVDEAWNETQERKLLKKRL